MHPRVSARQASDLGQGADVLGAVGFQHLDEGTTFLCLLLGRA